MSEPPTCRDCFKPAEPPYNLCHSCRIIIQNERENIRNFRSDRRRCEACKHNFVTDEDGLCTGCRKTKIQKEKAVEAREANVARQKAIQEKQERKEAYEIAVRQEVEKRMGDITEADLNWIENCSYSRSRHYEKVLDNSDHTTITDVAKLHGIIRDMKCVVSHMDERLEKLEKYVLHQLHDTERQVKMSIPLHE